MPSAALRALLSRSIDYAGLFPPAPLPLDEALRNYSQYLHCDETWMLNTFVLPIAEFDAAATKLSDLESWRISALGPKTQDVDAFEHTVKGAVEAISAFDRAGAKIVQCEIPLPATYGATFLERTAELLRELDAQVFFEAAGSRAEETIALLSECNSTSGKCAGFKLRTGGVRADAFPEAAVIAKALVASAKHSVPIKFTAGLHHPLRMHRDEVDAKMHGFLNVLGAGVLASELGWDEEQTITMLEDENAASFSFTDSGFQWREFGIATDAIARYRQLATSFGSCSFDEPREDLRTLGLL